MTVHLERLAAALADRYTLDRELGAGGMATVYLAQDIRHHRQVAIKVLRPELAAVIGADRFLSEIRTTANLQHPHILPLFDSGAADSFLFYVMPFVEGESLRDRLDREQQLPIGDAVRIAEEVASALDYAHRHGVIHRDIKPENIMLHDGRALVADFGIALAASSAGTRMTETGMSLGTPHYMSPEQAMGERTLDARTDVYALGCVLYEMLTGETPFDGPSAQSIIAKVMTERPTPPTATRDTVPDHVEDAVLQALAKLPVDRFASAAGFAAALGGAGSSTLPRRAGRPGAAAPKRDHRMTISLAAALVITAGAALWGWLRPVDGLEVTRQRVLLWEKPFPDLLNPSVRAETRVAMAPDGSSIVFSDSADGDTYLFIKRRGDARPVRMDGTVGAAGPFFSPDGSWIGFLGRGGTIRKVPTAGGGVIDVVASASDVYAVGTWLDDGRIVFLDKSTGLSQVDGSGGVVTEFLAPDPLHRADPTSVSPLPDSRGVLFTGCPGNCASGSSIYVYDVKADTTRLLVENATGGWYAPSGHLLYTGRNGGLFAVAFDLKRMAVTSGPASIAEGVAPGGFAMSASGDAVLSFGTENHPNSQLVWVTRDGREEPVDSTWRAAFEYPAVSPDGKTIAVSVREDMTRLWVLRDDGSRIRISSGDRGSWRPAWRPDGRSFGFVTTGGPITGDLSNDVFESPLDANVPPTLLLDVKSNLWEVEFSRDGQWMVVRSDRGRSFGTFHAKRLNGDTALVTIYADDSYNAQIALSPDSRWLAYTSGLSDNAEVFVASFPDMSVKYPVTQKGGTEPRWSRDGRELFYKNRGTMMALPVTPGAGFAPGAPRALFPVGNYAAAINHQQYDVSPDGKRFLVIRRPDGQAVQEALLVQGFVRDLAERMKQ